jgi:hypothetical protein
MQKLSVTLTVEITESELAQNVERVIKLNGKNSDILTHEDFYAIMCNALVTTMNQEFPEASRNQILSAIVESTINFGNNNEGKKPYFIANTLVFQK